MSNEDKHTDRAGELTESDQRRLKELIQTKVGNPKCELCGTNQWNLDVRLGSPVTLNVDATGGFGLNLGQGHPSAVMHCRNCGNTKLLSVEFLGFSFGGGEAANG